MGKVLIHLMPTVCTIDKYAGLPVDNSLDPGYPFVRPWSPFR